MENNKFNSVLQNRVNKDREDAKKDAALRKEYGIEEGRTVGIKIHKDSTIVGIWKAFVDIIQFLKGIFIYGLAVIGALAIIHPGSREVLFIILKETIEQIKVFAPFLPI